MRKVFLYNPVPSRHPATVAAFASLFVLAGFLFSGIWPLIVAMSAGSHPGRSGSVVGIVIAAGSLGVVAAPVLVSAMLQAGIGIHVFPVLALALLFAAFTAGGTRHAAA
jgi:MFS family permease